MTSSLHGERESRDFWHGFLFSWLVDEWRERHERNPEYYTWMRFYLMMHQVYDW